MHMNMTYKRHGMQVHGKVHEGPSNRTLRRRAAALERKKREIDKKLSKLK
jgi:hypothetical protein